MALPATDSFTSTNDQVLTTYSASWTATASEFSVIGATDDVKATGGNDVIARWNADTFNNNQYAQMKITASTNGQYLGPAVRVSSSASTYYGYYGDSSSNSPELHKMVAGTYTTLGSPGSSAFSVNDVVYIEANGTTITPKKNDSTTGTPGAQTDSAIASGSAGMCAYGTGATRGDDWEGGDLGGGAQTVSPGLISSTVALYGPTITTGAVTVSPSLIASTVAVYNPQVNLDIAPDLIASTVAVYNPQVNLDITPDLIASTVAVYNPQVNLDIAPDLIASTVAVYNPQVNLDIAPSLITSTVALYEPVITVGAATVAPELITSTVAVYEPTVTGGAASIAPNLIASTVEVYEPTVTRGAVTVIPTLIVATSAVYNPTIGQGTSNYAVLVGDGYADVSPKQIVRTSGNIVYTIAANCDIYPDFSANGLTQTIRVHKANSTGVPGSFTRLDSSNEPAAVVGCAAAIDSSDDIHIIWEARSAIDNTRYLRYAVFDTGTDTWGSVTTITSDLDFDDIGQGDTNTAIALDANNVPHIVYLSGTSPRVYYRNRSGGTWSAATQIDGSVTYDSFRAWLPNIAFDTAGRILVAWLRGGYNTESNGTYYTRVYSGSWGSTVQASTETTLRTGIDQSTSVLITPDNTYHITFILNDAGGNYIRYRYSTDNGATWTSNNPANQMTHDPALAWTGSKVRILGHDDAGLNIYYFEGDGGAAAWGSWTGLILANSANLDCSISARWAQHNHHYPHTLDIVYGIADLYVGTEIFALDVAPALITATSTVYTPQVNLDIAPSFIASTVALYEPVITVGAATVAPDLIASTVAVYEPTITGGVTTIAPSLIVSTVELYEPTVTPGAATIIPTLIDSTVAVYNPQLNLDITPDLIASTVAVYTPTVTGGVTTIAPNLIVSTVELYEPTVTPGAATIIPTLIDSTVVVYNPQLNLDITPDLIAATGEVYPPVLTPGAVTVAPELIASTVTVYGPTVYVGSTQVVEPTLIASTVQVFMAVITTIVDGRVFRVVGDTRTWTVNADARTYTVSDD